MRDADEPPRMLSTSEAAARLGVSANFIVSEIKAGRLRGEVLARPGRRRMFRIPERAIAEYVKKYGWTPAR